MRASAGSIEEGDFAHMFLDDLLHDGEAKASPSHTRRHIGLGDSFPVLGQADAGVQDVDHEVAAVAVQTHVDAVPGKTVFAASATTFNGFHSILDNIRERLRKLPAVTDQ